MKLLSIDPGSNNFALSVFDLDPTQEPACWLLLVTPIKHTVKSLLESDQPFQQMQQFLFHLEQHAGTDQTAVIAMERFIARDARAGTLSETIPIMIGVASTLAKDMWLPQAAEWKGAINRQIKDLGFNLIGTSKTAKAAKAKQGLRCLYVHIKALTKGYIPAGDVPHLLDCYLIGLVYAEKYANIPAVSCLTTQDHITNIAKDLIACYVPAP